MPLFDVVVVEHPTKDDAENGQLERLVLGPTTVVARDSQGAAISAVLSEKNFDIDKSRMEVIVRPFQ